MVAMRCDSMCRQSGHVQYRQGSDSCVSDFEFVLDYGTLTHLLLQPKFLKPPTPELCDLM